MTSMDDVSSAPALGAIDPVAAVKKTARELGDALAQVQALKTALGGLPSELAQAAAQVASAAQHFSHTLVTAVDDEAVQLMQRGLHPERFDAIVGLTKTLGTAVKGLEPYAAHTVAALGALPSPFEAVATPAPNAHEDFASALDDLVAAVAGLAPAEELGGVRHLQLACAAAKAALAEVPEAARNLLLQLVPVALVREATAHLSGTAPHLLGASAEGTVPGLEIAALALQVLQRIADYFQAVVQLGLQVQIGGGAHGALSGIVGWAAGPAAHLGLGAEVLGGVAAGTTAIDITGGLGAIVSGVFALARLVISTRVAWIKAATPAQTPSLAEVARAAEAAYQAREVDTDPATRARLASQIATQLDAARPAFEAVVRVIHPALEAVDAAHNAYKVDVGQVVLHGTLEALLDAQAPPARTLALGEVLFTRSGSKGDVACAAAGGLAGTGAQRRVNAYPGDVDLGEAVLVSAPSIEQASAALAKAMQDCLTRAQAVTEPLPVLSLGMSVPYPKDHPNSGHRMTWTAAEIAAGEVQLDGRTYTLAEAFAQPTTRAPNTYWRSAIDEAGTWGEVTKVITYRLQAGKENCGTPSIGQDYQTVSFARPPFADTARLALADALLPAVAGNLSEHPLKANKRAYTITRLFDDVAAGQAIAPQLTGVLPRRVQVTEHLSLFTEEVIAPDGVGAHVIDAARANAQLLRLEKRVLAVNIAAGAAIAAARSKAPADPRGDGELTAALRAVVQTLEAVSAADTAYRGATEAALNERGFLFPTTGPKAVSASRVIAPPVPTTLEAAHAAWRAGELGAARAAYGKLGDRWAARLQAAWIDGAFGDVPAETLDALEASAPSAAARGRVAALRGHLAAGAKLEGGADAWSLHQLRANPEAKAADFWSARAHQAARAGQYGLAHACFVHAEACAPHELDPPPALARTNHQAASHLAVL